MRTALTRISAYATLSLSLSGCRVGLRTRAGAKRSGRTGLHLRGDARITDPQDKRPTGHRPALSQ